MFSALGERRGQDARVPAEQALSSRIPSAVARLEAAPPEVLRWFSGSAPLPGVRHLAAPLCKGSRRTGGGVRPPSRGHRPFSSLPSANVRKAVFMVFNVGIHPRPSHPRTAPSRSPSSSLSVENWPPVVSIGETVFLPLPSQHSSCSRPCEEVGKLPKRHGNLDAELYQICCFAVAELRGVCHNTSVHWRKSC